MPRGENENNPPIRNPSQNLQLDFSKKYDKTPMNLRPETGKKISHTRENSFISQKSSQKQQIQINTKLMNLKLDQKILMKCQQTPV